MRSRTSECHLLFPRNQSYETAAGCCHGNMTIDRTLGGHVIYCKLDAGTSGHQRERRRLLGLMASIETVNGRVL